MKSFMKSSIVQARAPRGRIARAIVALAFAGLFTAACGDPTGPETLSTLTIAPTTATIQVSTPQVNNTVQFTATGTRSGEPVTTLVGSVWSVTGGGTISSSGLFTAGTTPGTSTVTVTCGGLSSVTTVIVTAGPLFRIIVTPDTTLVIGATAQFRARGEDANGNVVAITPVWSATNPPGTIIPTTGFFTAGNTIGSFPNSVQACVGTICDEANVTVIAGPLFRIIVTPDTTLVIGATAQFRARGEDAGGNVVAITPVWSATNPPGTIIPTTGFFTAGNTTGTFPNSVQACVGTICDQADVTVISPPAPPALGGFTVLARQAVTCTDGSITGDVGTFQGAPTGSITLSTCPITGGTPQVGTAASIAAYNNYLTAYAARAPQPGDCDVAHTLSGSLAGVTLAPGIYCFDAAASLTGLLTLNGPPTGLWLFKIGTSGTGALTGNSFTVLMAGGAQACNVTWWVAQAASMTDSFFKGTILAGAGITLTRTDHNGNTWAGASGVGDVTFTGPGNPVIGCP